MANKKKETTPVGVGKASFLSGDVVRSKRSRSYHKAGKIFSAFSEYNFTRPLYTMQN
jgi:hypothetical protein